LRATRHLPRLLRLVWETDRRMSLAMILIRGVRAVLPLLVLWVGKLIIDAVVGIVGGSLAGRSIDWSVPALRHLALLVGAECGLAILGEVLARISALVESLLGDLVANRTSIELMEHAASLDLDQLENAEIYDKLERARRQTVGRIGLVTGLLASVQDLITLITLAGALTVYVPWLLVLLGLAVLPQLPWQPRERVQQFTKHSNHVVLYRGGGLRSSPLITLFDE